MALFTRKRVNPLFPEHQALNKSVKEEAAAESYTADTGSLLPQDILREISAEQLTALTTGEMHEAIRPVLQKLSDERDVKLDNVQENELIQDFIDDMVGFGPLEPLLADETITDILVNGPDQILIERDGIIEPTDIIFRDEQHLRNLATRIANRIGRRIDEAVPMVDARLADDSRINIIISPLSLSGTTMSIRKFCQKGLTLEVMQEKGSLNKEASDFIALCVQARLNILVSGGTGAGKTTLLNALSDKILEHERVITIEDTAELKLVGNHVVRLESRAPNLEGEGEVSIRDLVRNALRMRPDRMIIGEVRGAEVVDMLQALNTGHQGSMSTIHANEPREALIRLENMAYLGGLKIDNFVLKQLISGAIDLIIHLERMGDGTRRILAISEITGESRDNFQLHNLFQLNTPVGQAGPSYIKAKPHERLMGKFTKAGLTKSLNHLFK